MAKLFLIIICFFSIHTIEGSTSDLHNISNLFEPLTFKPALPDNFVAMSPSGDLGFSDWVYFGPEKVLKAYFTNPDSLKEAIIRAKLSTNVLQTGNEIGGGSQYLEALKTQLPHGFESYKYQWNNHPVLAIKVAIQNQFILTAWAGLNAPHGNWTLMFNLVYPEGKGFPNEANLALWNNFLINTK